MCNSAMEVLLINMNLYENENKNRNHFYDELIKSTYFKDKNLLIDKEVPVPYKHIYIPNLPKAILEIWCFKQDICIYEKLFDKKIGYKDARIISSKLDDELIYIKLEKDSSQNSHHVALPYVIIETKMGKNINTHELLAYSEKVQMIKTIFPFCRFIMLFFGEPPTRAYRHGLNFDEILYLDDLSSEKITYKIEKIKNNYENAIHDIIYMKA